MFAYRALSNGSRKMEAGRLPEKLLKPRVLRDRKRAEDNPKRLQKITPKLASGLQLLVQGQLVVVGIVDTEQHWMTGPVPHANEQHYYTRINYVSRPGLGKESSSQLLIPSQQDVTEHHTGIGRTRTDTPRWSS